MIREILDFPERDFTHSKKEEEIKVMEKRLSE